jgi:hypothetical protein
MPDGVRTWKTLINISETTTKPGGPDRRQPIEVTLSCDHKIFFSPPPHVGDTVLCRSCDDYRVVVKGTEIEWVWRCRQCQFQTPHRYAYDRKQCFRMAIKHSETYPHWVLIFLGDDLKWAAHDGMIMEPEAYPDFTREAG